MFNRFFGPFAPGRPALGLLLIRVVFGLGMMQHGWGKIQNPFGWMPAGAPVPGILQALAALSEFGGGLALILGLLTPFAALGILCTMAVAFVTVHLKAGNPFVSEKPGGSSYELVAFYFIVALGLLFTGPGALSLDALLFGRNRRADGLDIRHAPLA